MSRGGYGKSPVQLLKDISIVSGETLMQGKSWNKNKAGEEAEGVRKFSPRGQVELIDRSPGAPGERY